MAKKLFLSVLLIAVMSFAAAPLAQSAVPAQQHTTQTIIVNGQQAMGVTVVQKGVVQAYTCASPQPYTSDQSTGGWACYDATTGTWLLNAQPPQTAEVYQQPVYQQPPPYYPPPPPVYNYYGYPDPYAYAYPYGYYPYGYYGGPLFAFGFGFGHGYYGHRYYGGYRGPAYYGHGYYGGHYGRGYYGHGKPFGHGYGGGSFGHGSFGHGSFGHGGGHGHR